MTPDLNSLIADKKKVDEEFCLICNKYLRSHNGTRIAKKKYKLCGSCYEKSRTNNKNVSIIGLNRILKRIKSEALAKGISVATKLIEDEIKWLEKVESYWEVDDSDLWQPVLILVRDRIKYLKGLLEKICN